MADERDDERIRTARCACGALSVTTRGEPARVNICSCEQCQRRSGSAFTYTAFFPQSAVVAIVGEPRTWRILSDRGRWQDYRFCPTSGVMVFSRMESMPGQIAIAVGSFGDRDFPAPPKFYWASRKHNWLEIPPGIERVETQ